MAVRLSESTTITRAIIIRRQESSRRFRKCEYIIILVKNFIQAA